MATYNKQLLVRELTRPVHLGLDMTVTREQSSVYVRSDFAVSL